MPSLAIVIPYYKIDFFEETLASVAAQTDKRFTLYIGNDASPHDPLPLIRKYFPEGDYRYFDYKYNLGGQNLAMQWERILENVTEEWFQILGDDDMVSENFVAEFYLHLPQIESHHCKVIKYSRCIIDELGRRQTVPSQLDTLTDRINNWNKKWIYIQPSSLSEYTFNRQNFKTIGFRKFPLAWGSDDVAVFETADHYPILCINNAVVFVRMSNSNISGDETKINEKLVADHMVRSHMLLNYLPLLSWEYIDRSVKEEINYAYRHGINHLKINPLFIYFSKGKYISGLKWIKNRVLYIKR